MTTLTFKQFIQSVSSPNPLVHKLRDDFYQNDKSVYMTADWMQMPFQDKFKFFINNLIQLFNAIEKQPAEHLEELILKMTFIAPTGGIFLTYNGFYPPIKLLGTDDQVAKWQKLVLEGRLIGAYAQTELGHGSDVQSLQATATYDKERKSWILNSPSVKSVKFWPGGLGILCTHVVCQAQTYVDGKYHGLQTFAVQIRDTKTYKLFEGVEAGDIGPKLGYAGTDNGYLQFTNYAVPRDSLLMRFITVEEDGTVKTSHDKNAIKIGYGGMLGLRVGLSLYFLFEAYRGTLISYRGWKTEGRLGALERRKLLREFAGVFTGMFTLEGLTAMHKKFSDHASTNLKKALLELEELHLMSCGIKAVYSWRVVDVLRRFATDHTVGNLLVSGIAGSYSERVPTVTYEGDNVVMLQQTARGLCKYMKDVESEEFKNIPKSFKFLADLRGLLEKGDEIKALVENAEQLLDMNKVEEIINVIGLFSVKECFDKMKESFMNGETINKLWNEKLQQLMIEMALTVTRGITFKMARQLLAKPEVVASLSQDDLKIFQGLVLINGLEVIQKDLNNASRFKIGNEPEKFKDLVRAAQEILFKQFEGKVEYIADNQSFYEEELFYVRDYKQYAEKNKVGDRIKASLEVGNELKQKYINTFSKL